MTIQGGKCHRRVLFSSHRVPSSRQSILITFTNLTDFGFLAFEKCQDIGVSPGREVNGAFDSEYFA